MEFTSKNSFVFFRTPSGTIKKYVGEWREYKEGDEGFIVQPFVGESYILANVEQVKTGEDSIVPPVSVSTPLEIRKEEYLVQLEQFIKACYGDLDKVISSRVLSYLTDKQVDIYKLFLVLEKKYPDAFVYLLNIPQKGMWMGATPEILLQKKEVGLETMALAGSRKIKNQQSYWGSKEQEEHNFVIEDIENKLNRLNLDFFRSKTKTVQAGEVAHLQTKINISVSSKSTSKQIADTLHPTSAVCGMPQQKALQFILENEKHQRGLYTGYLGIVEKSKVNLYVNLRCMQVFQKRFDLYIGGGITKDSVAEKEWEETELKSRTLLSVIEKM